MENTDEFQRIFARQHEKCAVCGQAMAAEEYWAVNTPEGVRLIHGECFSRLKVSGCHAQLEILRMPEN